MAVCFAVSRTHTRLRLALSLYLLSGDWDLSSQLLFQLHIFPPDIMLPAIMEMESSALKL